MRLMLQKATIGEKLLVNGDWVTNGRWMLRKDVLTPKDAARFSTVDVAAGLLPGVDVRDITTDTCKNVLRDEKECRPFEPTPWLHEYDGLTARAYIDVSGETENVAWIQEKYHQNVIDNGGFTVYGTDRNSSFLLKGGTDVVGVVMPVLGPDIASLPKLKGDPR